MVAADIQTKLAEWQAALGKKNTFESTCSALQASPEALEAPQARQLLQRARTLLRSRYSSRPFWLAGRELFRAAQAQAQAGGDAAFQQQLQEYIVECNEFLGEEAEGEAAAPAGSGGDGSVGGGGSSSATAAAAAGSWLFNSEPPPPARGGHLFEGQLSSGQAEPSGPARRLGLLDLLGPALGQQLAAAAAAEAGGQPPQAPQQQPGGSGTSGSGEQDSQQQQQPEPEEAAAAAEAAQAVPEAVLEAVERELDAIAVALMEQTGQQAQRAAPPASKRVVSALPREELTQARLAELGGADVRCPVCMEELAAGAEVQVMPCKHVFHPPCLAPWLENNNSCPTCRHELPTDDAAYERRKEREREEEEDRRGAANAVSHNEFLYI